MRAFYMHITYMHFIVWNEHTDHNFLYLVSALILGQTEKAIATFQALVEFNFFNPTLQEEHSLLSFFEAFWDSEVPR